MPRIPYLDKILLKVNIGIELAGIKVKVIKTNL